MNKYTRSANPVKVRVAEYRDATDAVFRKVSDYHACAGLDEKARWLEEARKASRELTRMECPRATERDRARRERALDRAAAKIMLVLDDLVLDEYRETKKVGRTIRVEAQTHEVSLRDAAATVNRLEPQRCEWASVSAAKGAGGEYAEELKALRKVRGTYAPRALRLVRDAEAPETNEEIERWETFLGV